MRSTEQKDRWCFLRSSGCSFGTLASVGFCFGGLRESRSEFVRVFSFPQTSGSQHEVEGCWKDEELEELGPIRGVRSPEVFGVERTPRDFGSSLNGCELPKPKHPQVHISNAVARQGMWKVLKTGSWIGVIMWVSLFVLICFYCYILLYKHTYKSIYIYTYNIHTHVFCSIYRRFLVSFPGSWTANAS